MESYDLTRYALLCGSAPNDYRQKKLDDLHNSLLEKNGWNVTCMANGTDEFMLEYAMNNIFGGNVGDEVVGVLLYFCTEKPLLEDEKTFWLQKWEIRKDVVAHYVNLAKQCGIDFQVIYDFDCNFVSEESLGYEQLTEEERREFVAKVNAGLIRIG